MQELGVSLHYFWNKRLFNYLIGKALHDHGLGLTLDTTKNAQYTSNNVILVKTFCSGKSLKFSSNLVEKN